MTRGYNPGGGEIYRRARRAAGVYLQMRGYEIIELLWQQSNYSVDIIARRDEVMYFVSVRCNLSDPDMSEREEWAEHARDLWVEENKWQGQAVLAHIEVEPRSYAVFSFNVS